MDSVHHADRDAPNADLKWDSIDHHPNHYEYTYFYTHSNVHTYFHSFGHGFPASTNEYLYVHTNFYTLGNINAVHHQCTEYFHAFGHISADEHYDRVHYTFPFVLANNTSPIT
jgi:hypothetical protein